MSPAIMPDTLEKNKRGKEHHRPKNPQDSSWFAHKPIQPLKTAVAHLVGGAHLTSGIKLNGAADANREPEKRKLI